MENNQPTLAEDIKSYTDWIINAMSTSGYKLDFSLDSMKEVDRFFDEQNKPGGILNPQNRGSIMFAIGSYIGESVIKMFGGEWITDDNDPQGETNIAVKTANGTLICPVQRCIKRLLNGDEDSIYAYVYALKVYAEK